MTSILFVGGDVNGRLTDDATQVCNMVGVDPKELQPRYVIKLFFVTVIFFKRHRILTKSNLT